MEPWALPEQELSAAALPQREPSPEQKLSGSASQAQARSLKLELPAAAFQKRGPSPALSELVLSRPGTSLM